LLSATGFVSPKPLLRKVVERGGHSFINLVAHYLSLTLLLERASCCRRACPHYPYVLKFEFLQGVFVEELNHFIQLYL
jgi:hypothetical protein